MDKVLIMGGSYFIGKHVCEQLKKNYAVYVLNRGNAPLKDPDIIELVSDRNDLAQMQNALKDIVFDHVVDLSCFNSKQAAILKKCIAVDALKTFVFISTSAVYNIQEAAVPFKENAPLGGHSPFKQYAKDKLDAEAYFRETFKNTTLIMFRPPYVYGEYNYVLRERLFFHLIEQEKTIFVPATDNRIQFAYAKDLSLDIVFALEGLLPEGAYNVGDPNAVTFTQFINRCARQVGKQPIIQYVDSLHAPVPLMHYFPFFDYDNILSVKKLHKHTRHVTDMDEVLKHAYADYEHVKPIMLPRRMESTRALLMQQLTKKEPSQ